MTPKEVAKAWHSVNDRWFVRRNKMHDSRQWEVVHDFGGDLVSDETMKVMGRHDSSIMADRQARILENEARGAAVLASLEITWLGTERRPARMGLVGNRPRAKGQRATARAAP